MSNSRCGDSRESVNRRGALKTLASAGVGLIGAGTVVGTARAANIPADGGGSGPGRLSTQSTELTDSPAETRLGPGQGDDLHQTMGVIWDAPEDIEDDDKFKGSDTRVTFQVNTDTAVIDAHNVSEGFKPGLEEIDFSVSNEESVSGDTEGGHVGDMQHFAGDAGLSPDAQQVVDFVTGLVPYSSLVSAGETVAALKNDGNQSGLSREWYYDDAKRVNNYSRFSALVLDEPYTVDITTTARAGTGLETKNELSISIPSK